MKTYVAWVRVPDGFSGTRLVEAFVQASSYYDALCLLQGKYGRENIHVNPREL